MNLGDARWSGLLGGYRVPYDPRPALDKLDSGSNALEAWAELWQELFHQGDVGEASYAAVPELVRIEGRRETTDWNTYSLVAAIELARDENDSNPLVPDWLQPEYNNALNDLAALGLARFPSTRDAESVRSILSMFAITKEQRVHARVLAGFTEDEVQELLNQMFGA